MIYTRDAAGFEIKLNDKVFAVRKEYQNSLNVYKPILVKAKVYSVGEKMLMVTDGSKFWRVYPNQCVRDFSYD